MNVFLKKLFISKGVAQGAVIIALFAMVSKILGLVRYSLIASRFGTGPIADAYVASFRIPDFLYNALVLGALSTAFIPVFLDLYGKRKKTVPEDLGVEATEEGLASVNIDAQKLMRPVPIPKKGTIQHPHWDLANALMNTLVLALLAVSIIAWYFTPVLIPRLVSGFDPERMHLTITFTRILLLSPIIFSISNVFSSVLQAFRRFTFFALAPILYNLGIIIGIVVLYPLMGPVGLPWGVVLGALLHLTIQVPGVIRAGYSFRLVFMGQVEGVSRVIRLIVPRAIGLSMVQVNHLVNTFLASSIAAGSVAVYYNAYDLEVLPVSLVAVSVAVASFPVLGQLYVQKKEKEFKALLTHIIQKVLIVMIPLSLFMFLLRAHIVRLILGYGQYGWEDTIRTFNVFGILTISLVAQGLIPVFARAFYARENTKIPVIISVVSIMVSMLLAVIAVRWYGLVGIAAAFSFVVTIQACVLAFMLHIKLKGLFSLEFLKDMVVYAIAAALSGLGLYIVLYLVGSFFGTDRVWALFVQASLSFMAGVCVYIYILWIEGDENIRKMLAVVFSRKK